MADLIDRQAAIDALEEPCKVSDTWTDEYAVGQRMQWEKDVKALNSLPSAQPTIEAEPAKHGRWIEKENLVLCSKCGRPTEDRHDAIKEFNGHRVIARVYPYYCGFCGAKMDEVEEI